jgi:hypothetical protein
MSANINLLLHTDEESLKREKRVKTLNFVAVGFLIVIGSISLCLFILIKVMNLESIKKEQGSVLVKMSKFQSRQIKLFVLNNRIENIDKILKMRKDLSKITNGLIAKVPGQFFIDRLESDNKSVTISGQSMSLSTIGEFIDNLTDMARKKEIIKSLTLNSLILDQNGNTYQISVKSDL